MTRYNWAHNFIKHIHIENFQKYDYYIHTPTKILKVLETISDLTDSNIEMDLNFFIFIKSKFENTIVEEEFKSYSLEYYRVFNINKYFDGTSEII